MIKLWHRLLCTMGRHNARPHICALCQWAVAWECTRCGKTLTLDARTSIR